MMKTERGRQEAQRRHDYLIGFLQQIDEEFNFAGYVKLSSGEVLYDRTTKRRRFNCNRVAVINFRRIVVSLRDTGDIPDIFKPSTPLPDTRKKSNAGKSELGEPGTATTAKGTVSNKPRSTAKRSRKQPVTAPSKALDSYLKGEPATNKQQQSSPPPSPQPKH
ncbi:hypothetical protein H4S03_000706 [Coemansia sp. S3946]|nr:hypothetical protein H4S03_000706 [Coemansia sp. S3946]